MTGVKRKKLKIFLVIIAVLSAFIIFLQSGMLYTHSNVAWVPDYKKQDISSIINKAKLAEDDYELLFEQTGLTRVGIDSLIKEKSYNEILKIQQDFFANYDFYNEIFAPFTCSDRLVKNITLAPLKKGDIIISRSSHVSYIQSGHAGLVVDAENGIIMNASGYGYKSCKEDISVLSCRPTILVLRPKIGEDKAAEIADFALKNLEGKKYSLFSGIFGEKGEQNAIEKTHCSHLVWYAYKAFGIDIDSNKGLAVWPKDIEKSEHLELVQVYGINPEEFED